MDRQNKAIVGEWLLRKSIANELGGLLTRPKEEQA